MATRREVLAAVAVAGAAGALRTALGAEAAVGTTAHGPAGGRPFSIDDFLNREDIGAIVASRHGDKVAIQVRRSLNAGGFHGDSDWVVTPRGDIWVARPDFGAARKVTSGDDWFSKPVFSPDGTMLAMTASRQDGRTFVVVAHIGQGGLEGSAKVLAPELSIDPSSPLAWANGSRSPIVWIDSQSLLVVEKKDEYLPRNLSDLDGHRRRALAASATFRGDLSVRSWSTEDRSTCSPGSALTRVDARSGERLPLFTGDIRGASISPDRRHVAVVHAIERITTVPRGRMAAPLGAGGGGYEDNYVTLGLSVVDLATLQSSDDVPGVRGTGAVSSETCPVWADDSTTFGWPARDSYTSEYKGDHVYLCTLSSDESGHRSVDFAFKKLPTQSPLDSLLVAHLVTASPGEAALSRIERRPREAPGAFEGKLLGRSIGGEVARSGAAVVLHTNRRLTILRPLHRDELIVDGDLEGHIVSHPDGFVCAVMRDGARRFRVRVEGERQFIESLSTPTRATTLIAPVLPRGRQICVEQTNQDTRVLLEASRGELTPTRFRLNTHLAGVRVPQHRPVVYPGHDGNPRTGTLYLPTNGARADSGVPVVVYAYPDYPPGPDSSLGRINASAALQAQPLLAAGFAVFHAAFPVADTTAANAPMKRVAEAVLPALDALDKLPEVAKGRYGFYGHSNGGYAALALGAQTDRFKAIVAAAAFPDSFDVDLSVSAEIRPLNCAPGIVQSRRLYLEAPHVPYSYAAGPVDDPTVFIENSPLYSLKSYKTPTLLLYGENDVSLPPVEKMFLALQAAGVTARLEVYWGDSHVLCSPGNIRHAEQTRLEWFRRFL